MILAGPLVALAAAVIPPTAVARVETREPVVALTFDACATATQDNDFDRSVFEILKAEKVHATIFVAGRWLETHARAARELAASDLVELGNHSYAHRRLPTLAPGRLANDIERTERLIEALGRHSAALRPPFGDWNRGVVRLASRKNLPTVLWDVVSGDAGGHLSAEEMVRTVMRQTRPGSIVIFHINGRGPYTKDALPEIIKQLRARGLRFVFVSELLQLPDGKVIPAGPDTRVVPREEKRGEGRARSAG